MQQKRKGGLSYGPCAQFQLYFCTIKIHVCPIQMKKKKEIHVYVKNMYLDIYLLFR